MCGGIGFSYSSINGDELQRFYSHEEIDRFKLAGEVLSFFWQKRPVLPVDTGKGIVLFDWGNREKDIALPRTGWARAESLAVDKWRYLNPRPIVIPAARGYEKKVWFDLTSGIRGIIVSRSGREVVYMVTEPADEAYLKLTGHNRMPAIITDGRWQFSDGRDIGG